jgi:2'-5' RNA ligase
MFEGECRSFIVLFPANKGVLERETKRIVNTYYPEYKDKISDLHLTLCYFSADLAACKKIAANIDKLKAETTTQEIELKSEKLICLNAVAGASLWWAVEPSSELLSTRERLLQAIREFASSIDHEENWMPHIKITDLDDKEKKDKTTLEPSFTSFEADFHYMQLSRLNPETSGFEVVSSWKLNRKEE